jgi:tetratricopeptide (TPR) repeat protein
MPGVHLIAATLVGALLLIHAAAAGATFSPIASVDDPDVRSFHSIDNASRALYAGQNALQNGRYEEALEQYTIATTEDPTWTAAWYLRAYALVRLNRSHDALASVDRALALDPSDRDSNNLKAEILESMGRANDAEPYRRAAAASAASPATTAPPASPTTKSALSLFAGCAGFVVVAIFGRHRPVS